jgi:selenocysteine-specific elongation factor
MVCCLLLIHLAMIVGTAGHIDHGKTALVKALTGVDTDRLPEEKRRGISIDLGFAYLQLPNGTRIGFVDVPGHERFIRTMVAGISGIDCVMIVVAANEGPRPQTLEHLSGIQLLRVLRGCAVITKADLVSERRIDDLTTELRDLLTTYGMCTFPVIPVSSRTQRGLDQLHKWLCLEVQVWKTAIRPTPGRHFRLPIDRYFILPGHGSVVTGTVWSGSVQVDDRLTIAPALCPVRVRRIHANGVESKVGRAGQRCALNIGGPGLTSEQAGRGNWIVEQSLALPTTELDARLRLDGQSAPARIAHWSSVHLHVGTTTVTARVALYETEKLERGSEALARFVTETPILALNGDRFLIRDLPTRRIIGGGTILDPFPARKRDRKRERAVFLQALETEPGPKRLSAILLSARDGVDLEWFCAIHAIDRDQADALRRETCAVCGGASGKWAFHSTHFEQLSCAAVNFVRDYLQEHPEQGGILPNKLCRVLKMREAACTALLDQLIETGRLVAVAGHLSVPGHNPVLTSVDQAILSYFRDRPGSAAEPVSIASLSASIRVSEQAVRQSAKRLAQRKEVIFVERDRILDSRRVRAIALQFEREAARTSDGIVSLQAFRAATGVGRNGAIMMLDYFDRARFTRRVATGRRVLKHAMAAFSIPSPLPSCSSAIDDPN